MSQNDKHDRQDNFDRWLADELHSRQVYLEDEGFSDQVMAAVPAAPRTQRLHTLAWAALLSMICVIVILSLFPGWTALYSLVTAFLTLPLMTLLQIGLGLGLGITTLGALAIWQDT